jgi:hypothetical protein
MRARLAAAFRKCTSPNQRSAFRKLSTLDVISTKPQVLVIAELSAVRQTSMLRFVQLA